MTQRGISPELVQGILTPFGSNAVASIAVFFTRGGWELIVNEHDRTPPSVFSHLRSHPPSFSRNSDLHPTPAETTKLELLVADSRSQTSSGVTDTLSGNQIDGTLHFGNHRDQFRNCVPAWSKVHDSELRKQFSYPRVSKVRRKI